jgi:hypothetical protein
MTNKNSNKYDGQFYDRTWVRLNPSRRSDDGIWRLLTQARHNRLRNADQKNGSAIYVQASINNEYSEWFTSYTNDRGRPHRDINDHFNKNSFSHAKSDPLDEFVNDNKDANYMAATLCDKNPRSPLYTADSVLDDDNERLKRTIANDIKGGLINKNSNHLVATIIRPITIRPRSSKVKRSSSLEDKTKNGLAKLFLDRRCEGKGIGEPDEEEADETDKGYYVQLVEIIATDDHQQFPDNPLIEEAINWSTDKHNFGAEFISLNKGLMKLRRAQTDIRESRIRQLIPRVDYKKRSFAVSKSDLKLFTAHKIDDGH